MIADSGVVQRILVTTNGLLLGRIEDDTWDRIHEVHVSVYPAFDRHDLLQTCKEEHGGKIKIVPTNQFLIGPLGRHDEAPIPCVCACDGPMVVGDRVFLYCGPPVFGAGVLLEQNVMEDGDLWVRVEPGYMETYDRNKWGNMEYCKVCWANGRPFRYTIPHSTVGGNWR